MNTLSPSTSLRPRASPARSAPSADGVKSAVDWDLCFAGTNALTVFSQWFVLPKHCLENVPPENFAADTHWASRAEVATMLQRFVTVITK